VSQELELFFQSIKSEETRKNYRNTLKSYGYHNLTITDAKTIEMQIINHIIKLKGEGKSWGVIHNHVSALKAYYQINDVVLNIRKIGKFMPEQRKVRKDRAYTHQEISKMLEIADSRLRVVILLLASSGMRIGAISLLKLKHVQNYQIIAYEKTKEEYFTFMTPECKKAIDDYLDMRSRYGEKLGDNSPLIREEFNIRGIKKAKHIATKTLQFKLYHLSKRAGTHNGEVALAHGFRKFFTTQLVNSKINPEIREMLLGHKIGLASAYYRPTEEEMSQEYTKAVNNLTINEENRLRMKVEKLEVEKTDYEALAADIASIKKRMKFR